MNPHDEARRADDAKRILSEPVFKEAWAAYEARLLDEIANAGRSDTEVLHLRALLVAARKARAHIERIMHEGAIAAREIEFQERVQEKQRRWWGRAA